MKKLAFALFASLASFSFAAPNPATFPAAASVSAGGNSFNPAFSADGQHLVFVSHANNLVTNDDLGLSLDVFVRDLVTSNTVLVSVSTNGTGGANGDANYPSISSNGQFIAFASRASNLVPGDTNDAVDVFLRDVSAGLTRLVSVDVNGNSAFDPVPYSNIPLSGNPLISADGRWVFFESRATNLVAAGAPLGSVNIYGRDTWSNVTVLVTVDSIGNALAGKSVLTDITPDAHLATFTTTNGAVVTGITNIGGDVYIRDLLLGTTTCASSNVLLQPGAYTCAHAAFAEGGGHVVFQATSVDTGSTTLLLFNLATRARVRLSNYALTNAPFVSADGSIVAFQALSGSYSQILLWTPTNVMLVSQNGPNYPQYPPLLSSLSRDGRFVTFLDGAFGLGGVYQIYRKDMLTSTLELISAATNNTMSARSHQFGSITVSGDASRVAFDSTADDLAGGDLNGMSDIFLRDVAAGATELITKAQPSKPAVTAFTHSFLGPNSVSADGRFIVSLRYDDPSAYRDTNGWQDVFVGDLLSNTTVAASVNANPFATNSSGGSGDGFLFLDNTNSFYSTIISADGSTVAAVTGGRPSSGGNRYITLSRQTNGMFLSSGMALATPGLAGLFGSSDSPSVNSNGTVLCFRSDELNLDDQAYDGNNYSDVFIRFYTLGTNGIFRGTNRLVSISTDNYSSGNAASIAPLLSRESGLAAFATRAGNLLPLAAGGVTGPYGNYQIVAARLATNRLDSNYMNVVSKRLCTYSISYSYYEWIDSVNTNLHRTNWNAVLTPVSVDVSNALFSANNRFVLYSYANGSTIWRHDMQATQTNYTFVSYAPFPNQYGSIVATNFVPGASNVLVCADCRNPSVSADGSVVTYERVRSGGSLVDLFAKDLSSGSETLVSANVGGTPANGSSIFPLISGDGRYVVFQSKASDLVANDTNGVNDVFVRDRLLGVTTLVSANAQGRSGNGPSTRPVLAADGRTVVFQSMASDLAAGDYNDKRDVFVLKLGGVDADGDGMDDDWEVAYFGNTSRNGSGDFDGDGTSDLQEFLAGTDPTNGNSVFRVLTVAPADGGRLLFWTGNPARSYRAEFKDDMNASSWTALTGAISWNGSTANIIDATAANSTHRYYRAVRLP